MSLSSSYSSSRQRYHCLIKMGINVTLATSFTGVKKHYRQTNHPSQLNLCTIPRQPGHENSDTQSTKTYQQVNSEFAASATYAVANIISSAAAKGHPFDNVVYNILIPWASTIAMAHGGSRRNKHEYLNINKDI
ncbi:hypothetical protein Tco_0819300 [Tanacetum coccineum]|uniref:Uncharacterized protein n=1 Tax=Tanacetum coccineum TaxID=301880 RepID=A0ABQ5A655_9ASTR